MSTISTSTDTAYARNMQQLKDDLVWLKESFYLRECQFRAKAIFGPFIRFGNDHTERIALQLHEAVGAGQIAEQELDQS